MTEHVRAIQPRNLARAQVDMKTRRDDHAKSLQRAFVDSVPGSYSSRELSDLENLWDGHITRQAAAKLDAYLATGGTRFLLLMGEKGVGKSTLATTIAKELVVTQQKPALFRGALNLMSGFSFDQGESLRLTSEVPILLLDDLGAANEGSTPHQLRSMWAMIEARWSDPSKRTIITTNMAIGKNSAGIGLAELVGPSAWDRISDDLTRIEMSGESFRGV